MANNQVYISPAVITREKDQSYLQRGLGEIGAAFIGLTQRGPAFEPTIVRNFTEFRTIFGSHDENYDVSYAVESYLKHAGVATVIRVLGMGGYKSVGCLPLIVVTGTYPSPTTFNAALLRATASGSTVGSASILSSTTTTGSMADFRITVTNSVGGTVYDSLSLVPGDSNNIENIFGTDPRGEKLLYVAEYYKWKVTGLNTASDWFLFGTGNVDYWSGSAHALNDYSYDYNNAETPWIKSQRYGIPPDTQSYNLFKFHTLEHGTAANTSIKVCIQDMQAAPISGPDNYGSFNVVVRDFSDTDRVPVIKETFSNLNVNPDSTNFIGRRIGNRYKTCDSTGKITVHGDYDNKSNYIRLEINDNIGIYPADMLPWGFSAYAKERAATASGTTPDMPINYSQEWNYEYNSKVYYGVDFTKDGVESKFRPYPETIVGTDLDDFYLDLCTGSDGIYSGTINTSTSTVPLTARRFALGFYMGFDGDIPTAKIGYADGEKYDCTRVNRSGAVAFKKAIDTIRNPDEYDFNLLAIPGIKDTPVTNYALDMIEDRADAFYLIDTCDSSSNIADVIENTAGYDTSYGATYYPYVRIYDNDNSKYIWKSPIVEMVGAIAFNDKVGFPWYAPAGLNRGVLTNVKEVTTRLTKAEIDELYLNRVNPLKSFPNEGIVVWGQKTMQVLPSALDRVNVRRLLIYARKLIASATRYLVFEPNTTSTWTKFANMVNPILDHIKVNNGLYAFKVVMDQSTNTADLIDQSIMYGKIALQPTRTAEIILLDFEINRTGAAFNE